MQRPTVLFLALLVLLAAPYVRVYDSAEPASGIEACSPQVVAVSRSSFIRAPTVALYCGSLLKLRWTSDRVKDAVSAVAIGSSIYVSTYTGQDDPQRSALVAVLSRDDGRVLRELHPECATNIAVSPTRQLVYSDAFSSCVPTAQNQLTVVTPPDQAVILKSLQTEWPPRSYAFDRHGDLYVIQNPYEVEAFDSTFRLVRQYPGGYNIIDPQDVVFTSQNDMLVANSRFDFCSQGRVVTGFISAFKANSTDLVARFSIGGCPTSIATFRSDVYVADGLNGRIMVYRLPNFGLVRRITTGVGLPQRIRVDQQGRLYVLNVSRLYGRTGTASIGVYERGQSRPATIVPLGGDPVDMSVN